MFVHSIETDTSLDRFLHLFLIPWVKGFRMGHVHRAEGSRDFGDAGVSQGQFLGQRHGGVVWHHEGHIDVQSTGDVLFIDGPPRGMLQLPQKSKKHGAFGASSPRTKKTHVQHPYSLSTYFNHVVSHVKPCEASTSKKHPISQQRKKTILKQTKSDRKIHQPSHTRRRYVGWCQVSNTATTCPVRRRFASKTSSKLSLPAGVPSTIRRN